VLFVSPYVEFEALEALRSRLARDREGLRLLERLEAEVPIKPNPRAVPSLWYVPLIGGEHFFDGFGFARYRSLFKHWKRIRLDEEEQRRPPKRPLLPFLEALNKSLPKKWDRTRRRLVQNDDWLLFDLRAQKSRGQGG
jgi:hypothetical protein